MSSASLLPNGKQQFLDQNGHPLASGAVYFYIPNTTTFKTTWQDPDQITENTNPVLLDAAGEAVIYGAGQYRQIVKDVFGNVIWDELTEQPLVASQLVPVPVPAPSNAMDFIRINSAGTAYETLTPLQTAEALPVEIQYSTTKVFRPEDFNASAGDGVTDAGPALRSCVEAINAAGGGTLLLGNCTYLVKTLGTNPGGSQSMFWPVSGMTLQGQGGSSIIKLADGVSTTYLFGIYSGEGASNALVCNHFTARDFTIDFNGQNNQTTEYSTGIYIAVGDVIRFLNVNILNFPGSQPLVVGATFESDGHTVVPTAVANDVVISGCYFYNCGTAINSNITDSSDIYLMATGIAISSCFIATNNPNDIYSTGIEVHGIGSCIGCVILDKGKMFNVGSNITSNFYVAGCYGACYNFATVWNTVYSGAAVNTSVHFEGCAFHASGLPTGGNAAYLNAGSEIDPSSQVLIVSVKGCTFEFSGDPGTNIFPVMLIGPGRFYEFSDNTVANVAGPVMTIDQTRGINPSRTTVVVQGNTILNCCSSGQTGGTTVILLNPPVVGDLLGGFIGTGNVFFNDGGHMATCFGGAALPTASNLVSYANNASINCTLGP